MEADDLAGIMTRRFVRQGHSVRLVTRDKDWLQLVGPKVSWEDHMSREIISARKFAEKTGFDTPERFVQYKALLGDASDNIKGVDGIGGVTAGRILSLWNTVEDMLADDDANARWQGEFGRKIPSAVQHFRADKELIDGFYTNMKLMDLRHNPPVEVDKWLFQKGEYNPESFKKLCLEFGFHSILDSFEKFMKPFKEHNDINEKEKK